MTSPFPYNDDSTAFIQFCGDPSDPECQTRVVVRQPALVINQSEIPIQEVAETSLTASYAETASFALSSSNAQFAVSASYFTQEILFGDLANVWYVTEEGNDITNDGKTLGTAFRTIKKAMGEAEQYISGSIGFPRPRCTVLVSSGYYEEIAPIVVPPFTSIVGNDLRTAVVRPTFATRKQNLFLMNNGTYAYGLRLEGCEIDDLTNPRSGFFFAFDPGASIVTSPYIQNCTSAHTPADKFYVPLDYLGTPQPNPEVGNGPGGMIVDDSVLDPYSPLKSMIVDAYTQVAFNGMGLVVRGEGYAQQVSFFTNFSHVGVWAIEGGHASLLNSNTTFGDYGLRSSGQRVIVVADVEGISTGSDSPASSLILAKKQDILNNMITRLQQSGSYASSYLDTGSFVYQSTMKDGGILVDSIVSDLLGAPGRIVNFTQALFKGQDRSEDKRYTLPTASGFTQGAIAVFRVNDGLLLAQDFINSFEYMKEYIINDPDGFFGTITLTTKNKISSLFDVPINTLTSVVINNEPTYLQVFGSLITSTSHDFSYAGSGVNFLGLPVNQRGIGQTNFTIRVFQEGGGRVYHTSGDETGDFFAGNDFIIRQATGTIDGRTFNKALLARVTPLQLALENL